MKKIIFLFLIFSAMLFAKWEVGTSYTTSGDPLTIFITYDLEGSHYIDYIAYILIGVNVSSSGYSVITIFHENIEERDNLVLIVTDNEGNDVKCHFHEDDMQDDYVNMSAGRSSVLTKMLYNGKSAVLKNIYTDETLAKFDLKGIKKVSDTINKIALNLQSSRHKMQINMLAESPKFGSDIFKYFMLGANAICITEESFIATISKGRKGLEYMIYSNKEELEKMMKVFGKTELKYDSDIIYKN